MNDRHRLAYLAFVATVFNSVIHQRPALPADALPARPNIIFILADDAGIGDFGCYGGKSIQTPNIDRLAAEGMRFTNAYSGSAVCAPTRCVLMTGQHTGHCVRRSNQSKHGLIPLPAEQRTVAQLLKSAGYATGGFGKWGLGNPGTTGVPEKHGFDVWFGYYDQVHAHDYYTDHLVRNSQPVPLPGNADGKRAQYTHDVIVDESLKFIEDHKSEPFFLYAAWTLPHGKYVIPSDAPYTDRPWSQNVKTYAAMITRLDADVGRLMKKVKDLGLDERTVVVFSSDNGANPEFANALKSSAGMRGVKRFLYEGGIRAPLVVRWPGQVKPGSTSDRLTSHVDFFPTAAKLTGQKALQGADGVSILPAILGREDESAEKSNRALYWEIYEPFQQAVRMGPWKGYRAGTLEPLALYRLPDDPAEATDVAGKHPEVVKRIEAIMAKSHVPSPHFDPLEHPRVNAGKGKAKKAKRK